MHSQNPFSRLSKKLKRRFVGSKRKQADIAGGGVGPSDLDPQPGSSVVAKDGYGQGSNEVDNGQEGVGLVGSSLRPGDPEATSTDEHQRKPGKIGLYVDGEEVGSMDSSLESGGEVSRSRGNRGGDVATADGEIGQNDPPLESNSGILSNRGSSGGMWRTPFKSLLDP